MSRISTSLTPSFPGLVGPSAIAYPQPSHPRPFHRSGYLGLTRAFTASGTTIQACPRSIEVDLARQACRRLGWRIVARCGNALGNWAHQCLLSSTCKLHCWARQHRSIPDLPTQMPARVPTLNRLISSKSGRTSEGVMIGVGLGIKIERALRTGYPTGTVGRIPGLWERSPNAGRT